MKQVFSLLTADADAYIRKVMQASPIQLLDTFALYVGPGAALNLEPEPDVADYTGRPTTFEVMANPLTGNQSLVLMIDAGPELAQRCADLGNPQPHIVLSSMIHGIPRNYRAFMNSCEETFIRDGLELGFYAEFEVGDGQ